MLRLSPSSVNSQPWEFFIARTPAGRDKLMPAIPDFNRARVADASHLIVFAVHEKLDEQYLQDLLAQEVADGRYANKEASQGQDAGRRHFVGLHSVSTEECLSWQMRQAYIAQGFILFAAAAMGIDSTPIEGADFDKIDEILGLRAQGAQKLLCREPGLPCSRRLERLAPKVALERRTHLPRNRLMPAAARKRIWNSPTSSPRSTRCLSRRSTTTTPPTDYRSRGAMRCAASSRA